MGAGGEPSRSDLRDLLVGRPGWRLEPRSTPGASPLWCFVFDGKIEFSVSVDDRSLHLYVMDTDQDIVFDDNDAMMLWLRENRVEATLEREAPVEKGPKKSRLRRLTDWG